MASTNPDPSPTASEPPVCRLVDVPYYNQITGATVRAVPPPKGVCSYAYASATTRQRWSAQITQPGDGKPCSGSATTEDLYFVVTPRTTARAWRVSDDDGDVFVNGTICSPKYVVQLSVTNVPDWGLARMRDHLLTLGKKVEAAK
jgi:hypothetical protein